MIGALYFYVAAGLFVPGPYLFVLWAIWGVLAILGILSWRNLGRLWLLVLAMAVIWVAVAFGLGTILDWSP